MLDTAGPFSQFRVLVVLTVKLPHASLPSPFRRGGRSKEKTCRNWARLPRQSWEMICCIQIVLFPFSLGL